MAVRRLRRLSLVLAGAPVFCALRSKQQGESQREVLVLLHGLDSWCGTWQTFAERLARQGVRTVALDLRGHGSRRSSM